MLNVLLKVLPWCFWLFHSNTAQDHTIKQIKLKVVLNNHRVRCYPDVAQLDVVEGNTLNLTVVGHFDYLNDAKCSSERFKNTFLYNRDFVKLPPRSAVSRTEYATLYKTTKIHHGKWNCTFLTFKGQNDKIPLYSYENDNYTKIVCSFEVNVAEFVPDISKPVLNQETLYYIIGGVVALVIVIIIIIQTVIILHFKAKVNAATLPHLHRPSIPRDDTTRYSTMPGERKRSQKRQSSGIYQSLENLRAAAGIKPPSPTNIKDRPPMPLPVDDDEHIYEDGHTLQRMFTPMPPPVDTLPRKGENKKATAVADVPKPGLKPGKHAPGPAPIPMEDYDYPDTDTVELLKSQDKRHQKNNPVPIPPKPGKKKVEKQPIPTQSAPNTGGVLMNELKDNLLRKRMNSQAQIRPRPEVSNSPPAMELNHLRKPPPNVRPYPQELHPEEINPQKFKPQIHPQKMRPQIPSEEVNPQKLRPQNTKDMRFQQNVPAPQEVPNMPLSPQGSWALNTHGNPQNKSEETGPQKTWNQNKPAPGIRPQGLSSARSPPVSRVQPMVQRPVNPPAPTKPKPGFNPIMKPPPPEPQAGFSTIKKLPPEPLPQEPELYEAVAEGYSSSDEEWQYEALPTYNIYSM